MFVVDLSFVHYHVRLCYYFRFLILAEINKEKNLGLEFVLEMDDSVLKGNIR